MSELNSIESRVATSVERLQSYAQLYAASLSNNRICLGGMIASDIGALPDSLTSSLRSFFKEQTDWLTNIISTGKSLGELNYAGSASAQASAFLAALQGGLLVANAMGDETVFLQLRQTLISKLQ